MGEKSRTIVVHAFDDNNEPHGIGFSMSGYGVRNDVITCDKAKDKSNPKMKQNDSHKIVFELANRSSKRLRFPDKTENAMWVAPDDQICPDCPMFEDTIVAATHVSNDGEQLEVKNHNKVRGRYKFALLFVDDDDTSTPRKAIPFDPIWANNNGGQA